MHLDIYFFGEIIDYLQKAHVQEPEGFIPRMQD
jgi:hypothetical protein